MIVIGGSAGSLEVILRMLPMLGPNIPAIVLILHRKSDAESQLTELLAARSLTLVKEVEEKESIFHNTIYIAPANYHLLFERDFTFSLDASERVNYSRPSIDVAFESAAEVYGDGLTGILLSGANADGTAGFKKIKENGGLTIAQDPATAEIGYMPMHAITHHAADMVLNIEEIAMHINNLTFRDYNFGL